MLATLIVLASLAAKVQSPEPVVSLKPELLTFGSLAQRLTQDDLVVRCSKSMSNEHALVALKPRKWSEIRSILERGLQIHFNLVKANTWEIVPDYSALASETTLSRAYFRAASGLISSRLRKAFGQLPKPTLELAIAAAERAQAELNAATGNGEGGDQSLTRTLTDARDLLVSIDAPTQWCVGRMQLSQSFIERLSDKPNQSFLFSLSDAANMMGYQHPNQINPQNFNLNWMLEATAYSITVWPDLERGKILGVGVPLTAAGGYHASERELGPSFQFESGTSIWKLLGADSERKHGLVRRQTIEFLKSDVAGQKVHIERWRRISVMTVLKALAEQDGREVIARCPPAMELASTFATGDSTTQSLRGLLRPLFLDESLAAFDATPFLLGIDPKKLVAALRAESERAQSISLSVSDGVIVARDELGWLRRIAQPPVFEIAQWEEGQALRGEGKPGIHLPALLKLVRGIPAERNADWQRIPIQIQSPTGLRLLELGDSMPFWAVLANLSDDRAAEVLRSVEERGATLVALSSLPQAARKAFVTYCEALPSLRHVAQHPGLEGILRDGAICISRQQLSRNPGNTIQLVFALYPDAKLYPAGGTLVAEAGGIPIARDTNP